MALLTSLLSAMGCASDPQPFTVEGSVIRMEPLTAAKQVEGQSPSRGVSLAIRPTRVTRGDKDLNEAEWTVQFAGRHRAEEDLWVFTTMRRPLPILQQPGALIVATVDEDGFLLGVEAQ